MRMQGGSDGLAPHRPGSFTRRSSDSRTRHPGSKILSDGRPEAPILGSGQVPWGLTPPSWAYTAPP